MGLVFVTFLAVFFLIVSTGALLFYREAMMKRLTTVISPATQQPNRLTRVRAAGASMGALIQPLERVLPRGADETSIVQTRLIRAGFRKDSHLKGFYAAKLLVPLALAGLVTVTGIYEWGAFFVYVLAVGLGYLVPDFWLGNRISARQLNVRLALPEGLDFMVICIEAGLSLDQAALRAADELALGQPELSDELGLVNLEQRAGRARSEAWRNMAERTDVDAVRALTALIVQVDQFGSSISKALRVHSETLRTQRRQQAEEQAAKTAVKLVFPLVLFIFPAIFLVVLGPAMIVLFESFEKYLLR
jgi:tight adherence protein C